MRRLHDLAASIVVAGLFASLGCDPAAVEHHSASGLTAEHRDLLRALAGSRPLRPRLVGLSRWSACAPSGPAETVSDNSGCAGDPLSSRRSRALSAGRGIENAARHQSTGPTLHALGVWVLLRSRRAEMLDDAVAHLELAAGYSPANGEIWSDLAAAYYVRARRLRRPEDLVRSLAAADRALQAAPGLAPALFNRALALQALFLRDEAIAAWEAFLASGDARAWREEARAHRARAARRAVLPRRLSAGILQAGAALSSRDAAAAVAADPFDALQFAELHLLGDLGSVVSAQGILANARMVAAALLHVSGDRQLDAELKTWERALDAPGSAAQRERLRAGYASYREARGLYDELETRRAAPLFAQAARELRAADSPLHLWALYYAAVCSYWEGDLGTAAAALELLRTAANDRQYRILKGYASWMVGLIAANEGDFDRAFDQYRDALATFESAGLVNEEGSIRVQLSQVLRFINDPRASWRHLYRALAEVDAWRSDKWRNALFDEIAACVSARGNPETALYFQRRAVAAAVAGGQPVVISQAYAQRSLTLRAMGRTALARADATRAREGLERITDPAARRQAEAVVLVTEARLDLGGDPEVTVERLSAAVRDRRRRGASTLLPELQLERARLLASLGRADAAEAALLEAIEAVEAGSRHLDTGQRRSAYITGSRAVFDGMIRFQLDIRHDDRAALLFAERARVHEFFPESARGAISHAGLNALQTRLPPASAVLVYHVLDDRLLVWLIRRRAVSFHLQEVSSSLLAVQVENFARSLRHATTAAVVREWATRLYESLVAPMAASLAGVERLWVVPDGALFDLPFGALVEPASNRPLITRHQIIKALTAGIGTTAGPPPPAVRQAPDHALVIGDPAFDRQRYQELPALRWARREASAVAAAYPDAEVLVGEAATRSRLLAELARWEVVHLATHAVANRDTPELSMLVLAPDAQAHGGAIYARDIERLSLQGVRLVVLAACGTAAAADGGGGSFSALARPFLAAGVPLVVGSLWDIEDHATSRFFVTLHRFLRRPGTSPAGALQRTQISAMGRGPSSGGASFSWAAFEVYAARPELE